MIDDDVVKKLLNLKKNEFKIEYYNYKGHTK